jgi:quercetin dioxygenase-like cupin family protein
MSHFGRFIAASVTVLFAFAHGATAEDMGKMVLVPNAGSVHFAAGPPTLPKGVELAVLVGDPGNPGPFVLRVKIPANTVIAPHTHATAENLTVISGPLFHQMGQTLNKKVGDELANGGFVYLPANMPHSVWTAGEAAEVQVTGTGPFGVNYVNAADDPSKQ